MIAVFAFFPRIVFCSDAARNSMPAWLNRLARTKSFVVPNAVDLDAIDRVRGELASAPPTSADGESSSVRVVLLGRLMPIKNMATVIEAVARTELTNLTLTIVGDGPLRAELENLPATVRLGDRVHFTGLVPRATVYRHLIDADLCVSASRGEGLPVAVLEAMACECPVVLSDIAPHRELARATAIDLIDQDNIDGFASAIRRISDMAQTDRQRIGSMMRSIIEDRYSVGALHSAYRPIYNDVAAVATRSNDGHPSTLSAGKDR